MAHEYNNNIARHYAAFRPDLHSVILGRVILPDEHFKIGLDVGCGTGYSTVALAKYCDKVIGIDPNQPMLDQAVVHPGIFYVNGFGDDFSVIDGNRFDIVTFAGSLSYTKTDRLKSELLRTLSPKGAVIAYDFRISLDDLIADMGIKENNAVSGYNFTENLKNWTGFTSVKISTDTVSLQLSAKEAAHILLASSYRYQVFQERFHNDDPFDHLTDYIKQQNDKPLFKAEIFYARHCLS